MVQDVTDKESKSLDTRSRADRIRTRIGRLDRLTGLDEDVRQALSELTVTGRHGPLTEVVVRSRLVRRAERLPGPLSDRKLPPESDRPPAARLLSPRGIALRVYLTGLMIAQATTARGKTPRNRWPIRAWGEPQPAWLDWIAAVTDAVPGGRKYSISDANRRERQFKQALARLSSSEVGLVDLPAGAKTMNRYEGFCLLHESGETASTPVPYQVPPASSTRTFALPIGFFTNGWIHTLTNAEIAAFMMMADLAAHPIPGPQIGTGLHIDGDDRLAWFGLSKDTYDLLPDLVGFGLLTSDVPPERRPDGTFEDYGNSGPPRRTYYSLNPAGFDQPAIKTVSATLKIHLEYLS